MLNDYFHVCLRQSVGVVLPLNSTAEVISVTLGEICLIPGIPPAVLGVVNQRGRLLWVVELSDLLGLAPCPKRLQSQDNLTLVVLTASLANSTVGQESRQLGCVVSSLKGIVSLDPAKFKPVSARLSPTLGSFLSGVAEIEQLPVAILNTDAVLTALSVPTTSLIHL
jgi:twitching motility protein PilI